MKLYEKDYFTNEKSSLRILGNYEKRVELNKNWIKISKLVKNYKQKGDLLDIGCAYGHVLNDLRNEFSVYGIDISNYAINKAKEKFNLINLKQGDIMNGIPFEKEFDVITAIDIIEHLDNPKKALSIIYDKLKQDGILIIQMPTNNNILSRLINKYVINDKTHVFIPSIKELHKLMEELGFTNLITLNNWFLSKNKHLINSLSIINAVYKK